MPRSRVQNIQSGRQKVAKMLGLKELQQQVNALKTKASGREVHTLMVDCSRVLYDQAIANLKSVNAPHEVAHDLFVYGKNPSALLKAEESVTALVGLRKHGQKLESLGYVEWSPGRQVSAGRTKENRSRKKGARLVLPGALNAKGTGGVRIGENLGTMWEIGTSKMAAKPWWRPAVTSARSTIYQMMVAGYRKILAI